MRLRRLEFVVIGVTLALACFMGGFFTGRSWSAINIVSVASSNENTNKPGNILHVTDDPLPEQRENISTAVNSGSDKTQTPPDDNKPAVPQDTTGRPGGGDGKININLATQAELTDLPGIGNVLASRIVDYRRQHGDFQKIEDIRNVSGIGEKRFDTIQDKITVG